MKNVALFGFGKMGSSIARGWMLKNLNFKFFVVEQETTLRRIAVNDGIESYKNFEQLLKSVGVDTLDIIFLAVKPQQMSKTINGRAIIERSKTQFYTRPTGLT